MQGQSIPVAIHNQPGRAPMVGEVLEYIGGPPSKQDNLLNIIVHVIQHSPSSSVKL